MNFTKDILIENAINKLKHKGDKPFATSELWIKTCRGRRDDDEGISEFYLSKHLSKIGYIHVKTIESGREFMRWEKKDYVEKTVVNSLSKLGKLPKNLFSIDELNLTGISAHRVAKVLHANGYSPILMRMWEKKH